MEGCIVLTVTLVNVNEILFFHVTPNILMHVVQYVVDIWYLFNLI